MKVGLLILSTSRGRDSWKNVKDTYLYHLTLKTFLLTMDKEHEYVFYIGIDKGDRIFDNAIEQSAIIRFSTVFKNVSFQFHVIENVAKGHLTVMWNRLFDVAYREGCDYFFQCGDDIDFQTSGWVNDAISTLQQNEDVGLTGPINNNNRILTQAFVSRKHMEFFGRFFPEEIINWCCDDWYNWLYQPDHFFPLNQHFCSNNGGGPRYDINNDPNFINYQDKSQDKFQENLQILRKDALELANQYKRKSSFYNSTSTRKRVITKPRSFSTMCTENSAFELVGLLLSLSVHHTNETIYILSDSKTREVIESITPQPKLQMIWCVELDKYNGMDRATMVEQGIWGEFQMSKARVIQLALENAEDTLFLDCDIIIMNPIEDIDTTKSLGVSPGFIDEETSKKVGYYNGGMLWTNNKRLPDDWIEFTRSSRYYDQASIEDLVQKYDYFTFDETYNLQAWRYLLSPELSEKIASYISIHNHKPNIYYKNKPLKFIHTHFKDPRFYEFNQIIVQRLVMAKMYKELAIIFRVINNKWVLRIPKQPLPGPAFHTNDSYRELAVLLQVKNKDVEIEYDENTVHCWLQPNILTNDRDQPDHWCNNELQHTSLMLLGNGDVEKEGKRIREIHPRLKMKKWIDWPRRPTVLEEVLQENGILSFEERDIQSIFIGNFENSVQEKYRNNTKWDSVIDEYHCTEGSKHKFTVKEYLLKLRQSRYGLCLRGYGSKCHREMELMAFGTVPIVTPEVTIHSYMDPLVEGVHYIFVQSPDEVKDTLSSISIDKWKYMSSACYEWYQRNIHSDHCWNTMISNILYD